MGVNIKKNIWNHLLDFDWIQHDLSPGVSSYIVPLYFFGQETHTYQVGVGFQPAQPSTAIQLRSEEQFSRHQSRIVSDQIPEMPLDAFGNLIDASTTQKKQNTLFINLSDLVTSSI